MNRELKYRAWITRYSEPYMLYLEPTKNWFDYEDGFVLAFSIDGYSEYGFHECTENNNNKTDFKIMEYIGLKDMHNNDIYEFDILRHPQATEPEDLGWVIEYENKSASFIMKCLRLINGEELRTPIDASYLSKCEIIGNILENPIEK